MDIFEKYLFLILALTSYLCFLITSIILRVGKNSSPLSAFNSLHFRSSLLYLFLASFSQYYFFSITWLSIIDVLVGLFFYFGFHYGIFQNLYGLAQRSISASLLIQLNDVKGISTFSKCQNDYADGKGFSYIKNSRLKDMVNLGFVTEQQNVYSISSRGILISKVIKFFLKLWGLNQLGKKQ
jgi:hypothetical protein